MPESIKQSDGLKSESEIMLARRNFKNLVRGIATLEYALAHHPTDFFEYAGRSAFSLEIQEEYDSRVAAGVGQPDEGLRPMVEAQIARLKEQLQSSKGQFSQEETDRLHKEALVDGLEAVGRRPFLPGDKGAAREIAQKKEFFGKLIDSLKEKD